MFGFKKNDLALVIAERESFLAILIALIELLKNSGNNAQAEFIQKLIALINQNNFGQFVKLINGVDMWGGAGAVWEVYIEDQNKRKEFENEMLRLISLMERTKIIGIGIKPIKKIFEDNMETRRS